MEKKETAKKNVTEREKKLIKKALQLSSSMQTGCMELVNMYLRVFDGGEAENVDYYFFQDDNNKYLFCMSDNPRLCIYSEKKNILTKILARYYIPAEPEE